MKKIAILIMALAALILPGIIAQDTSAIFDDTETSAGNMFCAATWEVELARFLVTDDGGNHGSQQNAVLGRLFSDKLLINKRVSNETGEETKIENVTSQGQEAPVGKE